MKKKEVIIKLEDVHKSYYLDNGEEIQVLKWIDLEIYSWEFVAIMWESWWWKSTLLNIVACLHPLSAWKYILEWDNIWDFKHENILAFIRNKKMWFIFQQFNLLPRLSALQNVALPAIYAWEDESKRETRAAELLEKVWLWNKLVNKPWELSWWQQQRVSIARSLINNPEILLADEPTWALDTTTTHEVIELIHDLKSEWKTIVMVTHTPEVAKAADRIIFLEDGKVIDCDYKLKD